MRERKIHIPDDRDRFRHPSIRGAMAPAAHLDEHAKWVDMWAGRALNEVPADRPRAEKAMCDLYVALGLKPPSMFMWVKSPAVMKKAMTALANIREDDNDWRSFLIVEDIGKRLGKNRTRYWDDYLGTRFCYFMNEAYFKIDNHRDQQDGLNNLLGNHDWLKNGQPANEPWTMEEKLQSASAEYLCPQFHPEPASKIFYLKTVKGLQMNKAAFSIFEAYASLVASANFFAPYRAFAIMSERPIKIAIDERIRLHNTSAKAIEWPDGHGFYALSGILVKSEYITRPRSITPSLIAHEGNAEVRRALIALYGEERFLQDAKARVVSHGSDGAKLWCCEFRPIGGRDFSDEPFQMVEVVNATAEPDGSFRRYFIRVPPNIQDCDAAVAWTFSMDTKTYDPIEES